MKDFQKHRHIGVVQQKQQIPFGTLKTNKFIEAQAFVDQSLLGQMPWDSLLAYL